METNNYLSQNLKAYKELRNLSMSKLSKELDIPVSTLKSIMKEGNTTLDTVLRISQKLCMPLDALVFDKYMSNKLFIFKQLESTCSWFASLPPTVKEKLAFHMVEILEVITNDNL